MDTNPISSPNLIHHQHIVASTKRTKVAIGPKTKPESPQIKLIKNGETIESIEVQCVCGETIVIQCEYE